VAALIKSGLQAILLAVLAVLAALLPDLAYSEQAPSRSESLAEYAVKAAFLFKFSGFVEWPPAAFSAPDAPLIIGILGDDPFGPRLEQIVDGQKVGARPVIVRRTHRIDQARNTHILFISPSEEDRMDLIKLGLQNSNVLTVAEFDRPGIAIHFVTENNKVRFEVNLEQARRADLKLSSKLLSVAKSVHDK
jgi:hypothetical protein